MASLENFNKGKKRLSYVTRAFAHFLDYSGVHTGTWIMGVMCLETHMDENAFKDLVKERLLSIPRFRSEFKVKRSGVALKVLAVEEVDLNYHILKMFEDKVVSDKELAEYAGNIIANPGFDPHKPLWRIIVIPKLESGQSAIILCFNHSLADGISAIGVLLKLADDSPIDPTLPMNSQPAEKNKSVIVKRSKGPRLGSFAVAQSFASGVFNGLTSSFGTPDPKNALKMTTNVFSKQYLARKSLAQAEKFSLEEVKKVKVKFPGATVNDILLALMTMSVKAFLEEVNDPMVRKKIKNKLRGNFPINLRANNEALLDNGDTKNKWTPVAFRFPLDYKDGADCVWKVKRMIDRLKVSPQTLIQNNLGKLLMMLPRRVALPVLLNLNVKVSMMLSNVPGPAQKLHLGGLGVEDLSFFLVAPIGSYLGVLTYNGFVSLSVNFDESMKQDPQLLAKHWTESMQLLQAEVSRFPTTVPHTQKARKKLLQRLALEEIDANASDIERLL